MKRTPGLFVFACLILACSLVSCDAMFENNLFAGITHPKLSADSIQGKSPSELKDILDSQVYMDQMAKDQGLKDAVLDGLTGYYDEGQGGNPSTAEGQTAAILAANINIQTVPAAAQFAAGIISDIDSLGDDPATLADALKGVLPLGLQQALNAGQTEPPAEFVAMIEAFLEANAAYVALGGTGATMTYLVDVGQAEKKEIAVNAVICGAIELITPVGGVDDTPENTARALWSALIDPANAGIHIAITPGAFDTMTDSGPIGNLLAAAGLGF